MHAGCYGRCRCRMCRWRCRWSRCDRPSPHLERTPVRVVYASSRRRPRPSPPLAARSRVTPRSRPRYSSHPRRASRTRRLVPNLAADKARDILAGRKAAREAGTSEAHELDEAATISSVADDKVEEPGAGRADVGPKAGIVGREAARVHARQVLARCASYRLELGLRRSEVPVQ
jgi:hypothetical protein